MRTKFLAATAAALSTLAVAGTAQAAVVPVQSLTGDFGASNSTVTKTPDGVHFGTYADGGAVGGSLEYDGMNGRPLSDLTDFGYTFTYRQAGATTGAAPYARVFLDDTGDGLADHDVILDPSFCATTTPDQGVDLTFQMVGNSVRFDDDGCDGVPPDNQPYATAIAGHEGDTIVGLFVTQGFSTGTDVSALLRNITVNGDTFAFNVPPADGAAGATGPVGATGPTGTAGVSTTITRIVREPFIGSVTAPKTCRSGVRTLHVPRRKGEKLLSATAKLRNKRLKVKGRTITVPLAGQTEGNFNVQVRARYRSNKTGKVTVRRITRNLSVACS